MNKEDKTSKEKYRKVKLLHKKNLNLMIKLLCLLAAVSIWFYFDSLENPKVTANIENIVVELRNEDSVVFPDHNYEIFTGRNQRINIAVKGTEENIEKVKNNIVAYVDMKEAKFDQNTLSRLMNIYVDKKSIPAGVEIISQSEYIMIVAIDRVVEKTFDNFSVTPDLGGQQMQDGYYIGDDIIVKANGEVTRSIKVRGPEQILNKIQTLEVTVNCKDRIRSFTASGNIVLMDEYNNSLTDEELKYVEITPKNVIVEVPIIREQNVQLVAKGTKTGDNIYKYADIQITPSEVTVYGDTLVMDKEDLVLPIEIDETLITKSNGRFSTTSILESAGGVNIKNDYQVSVDVAVDFQKVKDARYWISADSFQPINIGPDVRYFNILTERIQIRIRGAEAIIDQLLASGAQEKHGGDIIAYLDMSEFDGNTSGVKRVPVIFEFDISNLEDSVLSEEEKQIYVFEIGTEPYYVEVLFVEEANLKNDISNENELNEE